MRPGRLDKLLYVGVAQHAQDKLKVLQALTRKFLLAPEVDLQSISEQCSTTLTGADLYALCADAWMGALRRLIAGSKVIHPLSEAMSHHPFLLCIAVTYVATSRNMGSQGCLHH